MTGGRTRELWLCPDCAALLRDSYPVEQLRDADWKGKRRRCQLCTPKARAKSAWGLYRVEMKKT